MSIVFIVFFVLFALVAAYFYAGNGVELVVGKDAKNEDGSKKYNVKLLSERISLCFAGMSLSALAGFLGSIISGAVWLVVVAPILFAAFCGFLIYIIFNLDKYKSRRYRRKRDDE